MVSYVAGALGLFVAALIVVLVRKDRLHATQGTAWLLVAVGFAFLGFAPGLIDRIAAFLDVSYPPVLALSVGVALLVLKILLMDIERSRIELRNQRLAQRIAMLEAELRRIGSTSGDE